MTQQTTFEKELEGKHQRHKESISFCYNMYQIQQANKRVKKKILKEIDMMFKGWGYYTHNKDAKKALEQAKQIIKRLL